MGKEAHYTREGEIEMDRLVNFKYKLGVMLVVRGLIKLEDLAEALRRQGLKKTRWYKIQLGTILVVMGLISRDKMDKILAEHGEKTTNTEQAKALGASVQDNPGWPR